MPTSSSVTTIWTTQGGQLIPPEMLDAGAAMPAPAKYSDLVYKI